MVKLHRLTVTGASVRKPEEHNGKLLITQAAADYHLQLSQTTLGVQSRSPDRPSVGQQDKTHAFLWSTTSTLVAFQLAV